MLWHTTEVQAKILINYNRTRLVGCRTFFKVAERSLAWSTFLGNTTMDYVDFFARTYTTLEETDQPTETAVIAPQDDILVAPGQTLILLQFLLIA